MRGVQVGAEGVGAGEGGWAGGGRGGGGSPFAFGGHEGGDCVGLEGVEGGGEGGVEGQYMRCGFGGWMGGVVVRWWG